MVLLQLTALAQAGAPEEVTPGAMISGMLVLAVMVASLGMIVVWATRIRETGHALPAAHRGILRVPPALTIIAIGLSLLMILMMALVALEDRLLPPVAAASNGDAVQAEAQAPSDPQTAPQADQLATDAAVGDQSNGPTSPAISEETPSKADIQTDATPEQAAEPADSAADSSASSQPATADEQSDVALEANAKAKTSDLTPEDMQRALVQTVIMDAFFFVILGTVVLLASGRGRVSLSTAVQQANSSALAAMRSAGTSVANTMWPDLDEDPAGALQQTVTPLSASESAPLERFGANDSPFAAPAETFLVTAGESGFSSPPIVGESFSWATEWRFAGEVFLAAYVPTAVLRILIVLLTVGILGEEPEQHPFLEMMDSGVGVSVLLLILLTAVFLAPLVEELQFRVVMLGGIAQLGHPMLGLVVSSMLFAFAHGFPDSLALVPLAFALGYTYLRRQSYITVMMVHFLFNGFNMVLALIAML